MLSGYSEYSLCAMSQPRIECRQPASECRAPALTTLVTFGRARAAPTDLLVVESADCALSAPRAGQLPGLPPDGVEELGSAPSFPESALP